jgi:DNA polymerase-3 subunit epsilon
VQRSFDDLGLPLHEVTFCVLDLETTGAAPPQSAITEVGAVKLRGGECLGTFQTLVNPGVGIPPEITFLTGITESMVLPAPWIEAVLPAFLEFLGSAVIVGHNVRFDLRFLQAAMAATGRPPLPNRWVDTCALARRLVRDEVPNCQLGTLAERLRLPHRPTHRALSDALATGDLLHALLERAGSLGVLGLDDLFELPTVRAHPQMGKLRLTSGLPRRPGVYLFRGMGGRVLYVGKATNLLRGRRPSQGLPAAAGDPGHRPHRLRRHARGRGPRGPAHPPPPAAVQPPLEALEPLRLLEAHPRRALSPPVGRPLAPAG